METKERDQLISNHESAKVYVIRYTVYGIRWLPTHLEELDKVVELPMDVSANLRRTGTCLGRGD
jgi:hypothetical protein